MKRFIKLTIVAALLCTVPVAFAQTAVQHSAQHLDAANICQTSATTAGTLTFTPQGSQSFYLTYIDIENVAGSSAVTAANSTTITSSGFPGTGPTFQMASGSTAGGSVQTVSPTFPVGGLKGLSGTAVVFTLPTFATNQTIRMNACGFFGS